MGAPDDLCTFLPFICQLWHLLVLVACIDLLVVLCLEAYVTICALVASLQRRNSKIRPLQLEATQTLLFVLLLILVESWTPLPSLGKQPLLGL